MAKQNSAKQNSTKQTEQNGEQTFGLQRIYVKDLSFESPNAPAIFSQEWKPKMNLDLNNGISRVSESVFEVVLAITITVTNGAENEPAFVVEVHQAGLFHVQGFDEDELQPLLGSYCPSILFPYARAVVSDLVGRGSFPQLLLAPVNFDALLAQAQERMQAEGDNNFDGPAGRNLQ